MREPTCKCTLSERGDGVECSLLCGMIGRPSLVLTSDGVFCMLQHVHIVCHDNSTSFVPSLSSSLLRYFLRRGTAFVFLFFLPSVYFIITHLVVLRIFRSFYRLEHFPLGGVGNRHVVCPLTVPL